MDTGTWAILLLLVGMALIVAEVFIPSGGIIGILAGSALLGSITCASVAWYGKSPLYFWSYLGGLSVLLPVVILMAFHYWPHTPIGRRAILEPPRREDLVSFVEEERKIQRVIGMLGETISVLNPAGFVRVDGERLHAQSEGMIIEQGIRVRVIATRSQRVIVRAVREGDILEPDRPTAPAEDDPLDFDLS